MFQDDILFTPTEPESDWIKNAVLDVILSLPASVFGEITPWDTVITQSPFIQAFTVDAAFKKIASLRGERRISTDTLFPLDSNRSEINFMNFVHRTPVRIMLCGDKNTPLTEIGDLLAKKFNTYLITPKELIISQVKKHSKIGTWLYWNIMEGRGIPIWVIIHLLKIELKKEKYAQKGFILSNWPIIPYINDEIDVPCEFDDNIDYEVDHEYQESLGKYLDDKFGEEEERAFEELSLSNTSNMSSSSSSSIYYNEENILRIVRGIKFVKSDGDEESVLKSCVKYQLQVIRYLWCTPKFIIFLDHSPRSNDFASIIDDLETFCMLNSQENIIQIDSRIGINDIYNSICNRFLYINYKVNYECTPMNRTENRLLTLDELCNCDKILPNCKWWISEFGRICPVNLYFGRRRWCNSAYPVRYLRFLFLCYSLTDRKMFMAFPGKYLNLVPTCRIAIIGPHRIGKSTLAMHLGGLFKADVYKSHILQAQMDMKSPTKDEIKAHKKELKDLETMRSQEHTLLKQKKLEEWSICVINLVNEGITKAFNSTAEGKKKSFGRFDLFPTKTAEKYFQVNYKRQAPESGVSQLILENTIFRKAVENISSADFMNWLSFKTNSACQHKQYVLDSAPVDQLFWEELLVNDELPDCVYFFKVPPVKKMWDIYSFTHNSNCINKTKILKHISKNFSEWKNKLVYEKLISPLNNKCIDANTLSYLKHLIELRFMESIDFSQKYDALQTFLQENNVICINIDVSNQTWTQTIVEALSEYLLSYKVKATALFGPYSQSSSYNSDYDYGEENVEITSSSTSLSELVESDHPVIPHLNYGSYQNWCPVLLKNHKYLLKGDLNYAAEYKNKIYVMHSKNALKEFLAYANVFVNTNPVIPLPKIFVIGLSLKPKVQFADNLAFALNVKKIPCMQYFTKFPHINLDEAKFSINYVKKKYNEIKENFLHELSVELDNGGVVYGFPLTYKQFKDLLKKNIYPECVVIYDDAVRTLHSVYRYLLRLHMLKNMRGINFPELESSKRRDSPLLNTIYSEEDLLRHELMDEAKHIVKPFFDDISRIESASLRHRIPIIKIPKYTKYPEVIDKCVLKINQNRSRAAYFEDVKLISMQESELLLNSGYYWFSRFKYSCPVDVGRLITVNHYEGMRKQENIYPCIYRDFIYFVNGKHNLKEFQTNPLDYINTCNPPQMDSPLRIAIYGPPKSGVTTICESISQDLGLRIITSKDFPTAQISDSELINYLQMYKLSTPNGVILDNLQMTPSFLVEAAKNNVDISLVIILVPSFKKVVSNWLSQNESVKNYPRFVLQNIYEQFCEKQNEIRCIRKSIQTCLFNIHYLDGDENTWVMWKKVKHIIIKTTRSISGYKLKLLKNRCANVTCLNLFYETLKYKRKYNHFYCQVCLSLGKLNAFKYNYAKVGPDFYTNKCQHLYNQPYEYLNDDIYDIYKFSKPFEYNELIEPIATQKKYAMSMFQYKSIIYWTCSLHTVDFMMYAKQYDIECDTNKPLYIPFLVMGYVKKYIAYNGFCPIEYLNGKLVKGCMHMSVYYRKKVYLMANKDNVIEFLSFPEKYRKINFDRCLQLHDTKKTIYGLDEEKLSTALYDLANARPKHFKLSAKQSASSYLALKLKTESICSKNGDYWHLSLHAFTKDCKTLDDRLNKYKENLNPYIIFR